MNIDWSKAPEWAQELGESPAKEKAWLGRHGYSYGVGGGIFVSWEDPRAFLRSNFDIIEVRPASPWDGEVLPPVGTVCEYQRVHEWQKVEVFAVKPNHNGSHTALFTYENGTWGGCAEPSFFRRILTPEQIAAEERKLQRERLAYLIAGYMGFDDPREVDTKLAAYIFDHDYRKQVAP